MIARIGFLLTLLFVPSCACYTATNPAYNSEQCIVTRQSVDCTKTAVEGQAGNGLAIAGGFVSNGTVDTDALIAALVTAGVSDIECVLAQLENDFITKKSADVDSAKFLANYAAWKSVHRKGVVYKLPVK